MGNMQIYLRAKDKLFINGAVISVDRKVSIELLNDATFLLENHVMQKEEATTPLKQLYFTAQMMLIDPANSQQPKALFREMAEQTLKLLTSRELLEAIKQADVLVATDKPFAALKILRDGFAEEAIVMTSDSPVPMDPVPAVPESELEVSVNG